MDLEACARGEENLASASDTVVVLGEVWRGSFLPRGSTAIALDLLFGQRIESRVPWRSRRALRPQDRRASGARTMPVWCGCWDRPSRWPSS
jgi:hypothetical protein